LPSAAQTAFVRGPEGHLTKTIGNLWARTLSFSFDHFIIMTCSFPLSKFRRLPSSHLSGLTVGLPAYAQLSWFLQSHLVNFTVTLDSAPSTGIRPSTGIIPSASFTVTQNLQPSTGIIPSRMLCLDNETFSLLPGLYLDQKDCVRLPGLCKNSCQRGPQSATQLNRRAVRWHSSCKTSDCLH
jgi:hypothetical protein